MPNNPTPTIVVPGTTEESQELSIIMQKVLGTDNTPDFTSEQVDELLAQKREVNKLRHEDKIQDSKDSKFYITTIFVFIFFFSALILFTKPDLFGEVLSFLAGLFSGGLGGYGLSSRSK